MMRYAAVLVADMYVFNMFSVFRSWVVQNMLRKLGFVVNPDLLGTNKTLDQPPSNL